MVDEIEYLRRQPTSSLAVEFPTYTIPRICHLCNEETEKGMPDCDTIGWVCYECDQERTYAREALDTTTEEI